MLALGRALMSAPRLLLIDEPSVGLAPILVARTIDKIKELKDGFQLAVLMAEQNFTQAVRIADRGYVIVHGDIAFEGNSPAELSNNELIRPRSHLRPPPPKNRHRARPSPNNHAQPARKALRPRLRLLPHARVQRSNLQASPPRRPAHHE